MKKLAKVVGIDKEKCKNCHVCIAVCPVKLCNIGTNETVRPKMIIINITNLSEEQKSKLRGAIKFFSGDRNNIAISVKNEDKILPCGAIYLTEEILKQFEEIVGKENIEL